mgnify:CR=1 FL=1
MEKDQNQNTETPTFDEKLDNKSDKETSDFQTSEVEENEQKLDKKSPEEKILNMEALLLQKQR